MTETLALISIFLTKMQSESKARHLSYCSQDARKPRAVPVQSFSWKLGCSR